MNENRMSALELLQRGPWEFSGTKFVIHFPFHLVPALSSPVARFLVVLEGIGNSDEVYQLSSI